MRLLLLGGSIYAPSVPRAQAMLVVDREIAWLGPDSGAAVHRDTTDVVVHLAGALVAPAFVDAHAHVTATGLSLLRLDLNRVTSRQGLLAQVGMQARLLPGRAIIGFGWDETAWAEAAPPTRQELDRASEGAAVQLVRADGASSLLSTALIEAIPSLREAAGFRDSGWLTGEAHRIAADHVAAGLPRGLRDEAQRAALEHAAAAGVAAVHATSGPASGGDPDPAALRELAATSPGPDLVIYRSAASAPATGASGAQSGAAGVDVVVDGAVGSRTAFVRAGYASDPGAATPVQETDTVAADLVACTLAGGQARVHATGDAALDVVVDAVRLAVDACGLERVRSARHRVEHLSMATPEHLTVLAEAGIVASVQPAFDARWGAPGGAYEQVLGPRQAAGLHDFAAMARTGISLAFGSDSPATRVAPWQWVRAAMWHHRPSARLSGRAAFAAATRGGWRAARRDDAGVLEPGAPATFAVWATGELAVQAPDARVANWSTDPRSGTPGLPRLTPDSPDPACLATVKAGRPIHVAADSRVEPLLGAP